MRRVVGSVLKAKEKGKPSYIKMNEDVVLKKGQYVNLENEASEIAGIKAAVAAGKLTEDYMEEAIEKATERWNKEVNGTKVKDFVLFNLVVNIKE